jgi:hypothetical protein
MESAGAPDSAYQLGTHTATGLRVAIGIQRSSVGRLCELYGQGNVIFVTPDEVATMIAGKPEGAEFIGTVKRMWPGAVVN